MTESPENDSTQATPPLRPFTMPSQGPDPAAAGAPGPGGPGPAGPSPAGPGSAWPGAVPPQAGPASAQSGPGPATPDPAKDPWAAPGPAYGTPPGAPPPYGGPHGAPPPYGAPAGGYGSYPPYQPYPASGPPYAPVGKDPTLAEWWRRLLARVVDYAIVLALAAPLWTAVFAGFYHRVQNIVSQYPSANSPGAQAAIQSATNQIVMQSLLVGVGTAVIWFVYDWLQHGLWGQTLGKRALGTKVVRAHDRGRVSVGAAAGRAAVFALPPAVPTVGGLFWLANVLSLTWDRQRQCFHDKAAKTIVVKKSELTPPGLP